MKKEDFKTVKSIAIMANLACALMLCWIGSIVYWIIRKDQPSMYFMIGFLVMFIICGLMMVKAGTLLKPINFDGTAAKLKENAIKESKIFFFPLMFTISINRIRKSMWDYYIASRMEKVTGPVARTQTSLDILEELHEDGYIPQMEYDKRKGNLLEALKEAKQIEKEDKKKTPKEKEEEDSWI